MATEVAARLDGYRDEARLTVLDGGVSIVTDHGPRCEVGLPALPDTLFADAVVNCTGPMTDVSRSTDPLLRALVGRGIVVPDPLQLGIACTPERRGARRVRAGRPRPLRRRPAPEGHALGDHRGPRDPRARPPRSRRAAGARAGPPARMIR